MSRIAFVVAVSRNGIIGRDGGLPWHISSDLKRFKEITMGKPIIMGRKTWDSLPRKPLPGRLNIVVTRQGGFTAQGAVVVKTADEAIAAAGANANEIAVIGGGEIYRMFLPLASRLYISEVDIEVDGDTRFPAIDPAQWREVSREPHVRGPKDTAAFTLTVLDRVV